MNSFLYSYFLHKCSKNHFLNNYLMFELVYTSTADAHFSNQDILDVLNKASEFNLKNHITGCLLYHNCKFIQFLEGEKKEVKALFLRIKKDKRHFNVLKIIENEKEKRTFKNWTMAFYNFEADKIDSVGKLFLVDTISWFTVLPIEHTIATRKFQSLSKQLLQELKIIKIINTNQSSDKKEYY